MSLFKGFHVVLSGGLPNVSLFLFCFGGFPSLKQSFHDRTTPENNNLTSAPGGITSLCGYSHLQASSLGWEHDWCLPCSSIPSCVSSRSVCLFLSGMKYHECIQGHAHKLRMHHGGSRLCVISYYFIRICLECIQNHVWPTHNENVSNPSFN